jgi:hypothetical protein
VKPIKTNASEVIGKQYSIADISISFVEILTSFPERTLSVTDQNEIILCPAVQKSNSPSVS